MWRGRSMRDWQPEIIDYMYGCFSFSRCSHANMRHKCCARISLIIHGGGYIRGQHCIGVLYFWCGLGLVFWGGIGVTYGCLVCRGLVSPCALWPG